MNVPTFIVVAALCQGCVITQCVAADEVISNAHVYQHGVVAADHSAASEAGAKILREGGNVVDAAVATSFALSVLRPASCGIGGGGFMVIWDAKKQKAVALDYRERAPADASAKDYGDAADAGHELFRTVSAPLQAKGHITQRASSLAATQGTALQTGQVSHAA